MRSKKVKGAIQKHGRPRRIKVIEDMKKKLAIIHNKMLCHISRKKLITKIRAKKYLTLVSAISRSNECKTVADIGQVTGKLMRQMKTIIESGSGEYDAVHSPKSKKNIETEELRSSQSTPIYLDTDENISEISKNLRMIDINCGLEATKNLKVTDAGPVHVPMDLRTNCGDSKQHKHSEINNIYQRDQQICPTKSLVNLVENSKELLSSTTPLMFNINQDKSINSKVAFDVFVHDGTTLKNKNSCTNSTLSNIQYDTCSQHGSVQDFDQNSQSILGHFDYTRPNILEDKIPNETKKIIGDCQTFSTNNGLVENNTFKICTQIIKIASNFDGETKQDLNDGSAQNFKTLTPRKNKSKTKPNKKTEPASVKIKAVKDNQTKNMHKNKLIAKTTSCDKITIFSKENKHIDGKTAETISKPTSQIINTLVSNNEKLCKNCVSCNSNQEEILNPASLLSNSINTIPDSENITPKCMETILKTKKGKCRKITSNVIKKEPSKHKRKKNSQESEHYVRSLELSWVKKIKFVRSINPDEYLEEDLDNTFWSDESSLLENNDTCTDKVLPFTNY